MGGYSRFIGGSKHAHIAEPTRSHVSTGDQFRVGWPDGGDTRAEDASASHLPRVRSYQYDKVNKKGDFVDGDALLEKAGHRLLH